MLNPVRVSVDRPIAEITQRAGIEQPVRTAGKSIFHRRSSSDPPPLFRGRGCSDFTRQTRKMLSASVSLRERERERARLISRSNGAIARARARARRNAECRPSYARSRLTRFSLRPRGPFSAACARPFGRAYMCFPPERCSVARLREGEREREGKRGGRGWRGREPVGQAANQLERDIGNASRRTMTRVYHRATRPTGCARPLALV